MSIDNCCIGHVSPRENRCYECKPDTLNRECNIYYPIKALSLTRELRYSAVQIIQQKQKYFEVK